MKEKQEKRTTIRFSRKEDRELIKRAAAMTGLSEAAFVRSAAIRAARKILKESKQEG